MPSSLRRVKIVVFLNNLHTIYKSRNACQQFSDNINLLDIFILKMFTINYLVRVNFFTISAQFQHEIYVKIRKVGKFIIHTNYCNG